MKLDGFGLFVDDMEKMVNFYRDVLGFEIQWEKGGNNVFLVKDGVTFLLFGKKDFEKMTSRSFSYIKGGQNGHFEIALSVPTFADVDKEYERVCRMGAVSAMPPTTEEWGQRTCYIADPEGNLIEIGSFNKD